MGRVGAAFAPPGQGMLGPPPTKVVQGPQASVMVASTRMAPGCLRTAVKPTFWVPPVSGTVNGASWFLKLPIVTLALSMRVNATLWSALTGVVALVVAVTVTWSVPGSVRVVWTTTRGRPCDEHGAGGAWTMRRISPPYATTNSSPDSSSPKAEILCVVSRASTAVHAPPACWMPFQMRPEQKSA